MHCSYALCFLTFFANLDVKLYDCVTVGIKWKSLNTYYEHYNYVRYAQEKCVRKKFTEY